MTLTTIDEVKFTAQIGTEYTDEEITDEIDLTTAELYDKYLLPKRSSFSIDDNYTDFFIHPSKVHDITRVRAQVDTNTDPSGYLSIGSSATTWEFTSPNNYITLDSAMIAAYTNKIVRVDYIPKIFNLLATQMTAYNLITTTDVVNGETVTTPMADRIGNRITRYKKLINPRKAIFSSTNEAYDKYEYISYNQSDLR